MTRANNGAKLVGELTLILGHRYSLKLIAIKMNKGAGPSKKTKAYDFHMEWEVDFIF